MTDGGGDLVLKLVLDSEDAEATMLRIRTLLGGSDADIEALLKKEKRAKTAAEEAEDAAKKAKKEAESAAREQEQADKKAKKAADERRKAEEEATKAAEEARTKFYSGFGEAGNQFKGFLDSVGSLKDELGTFAAMNPGMVVAAGFTMAAGAAVGFASAMEEPLRQLAGWQNLSLQTTETGAKKWNLDAISKAAREAGFSLGEAQDIINDFDGSQISSDMAKVIFDATKIARMQGAAESGTQIVEIITKAMETGKIKFKGAQFLGIDPEAGQKEIMDAIFSVAKQATPELGKQLLMYDKIQASAEDLSLRVKSVAIWLDRSTGFVEAFANSFDSVNDKLSSFMADNDDLAKSIHRVVAPLMEFTVQLGGLITGIVAVGAAWQGLMWLGALALPFAPIVLATTAAIVGLKLAVEAAMDPEIIKEFKYAMKDLKPYVDPIVDVFSDLSDLVVEIFSTDKFNTWTDFFNRWKSSFVDALIDIRYNLPDPNSVTDNRIQSQQARALAEFNTQGVVRALDQLKALAVQQAETAKREADDAKKKVATVKVEDFKPIKVAVVEGGLLEYKKFGDELTRILDVKGASADDTAARLIELYQKQQGEKDLMRNTFILDRMKQLGLITTDVAQKLASFAEASEKAKASMERSRADLVAQMAKLEQGRAGVVPPSEETARGWEDRLKGLDLAILARKETAKTEDELLKAREKELKEFDAYRSTLQRDIAKGVRLERNTELLKKSDIDLIPYQKAVDEARQKLEDTRASIAEAEKDRATLRQDIDKAKKQRAEYNKLSEAQRMEREKAEAAANAQIAEMNSRLMAIDAQIAASKAITEPLALLDKSTELMKSSLGELSTESERAAQVMVDAALSIEEQFKKVKKELDEQENIQLALNKGDREGELRIREHFDDLRVMAAERLLAKQKELSDQQLKVFDDLNKAYQRSQLAYTERQLSFTRAATSGAAGEIFDTPLLRDRQQREAALYGMPTPLTDKTKGILASGQGIKDTFETLMRSGKLDEFVTYVDGINNKVESSMFNMLSSLQSTFLEGWSQLWQDIGAETKMGDVLKNLGKLFGGMLTQMGQTLMSLGIAGATLALVAPLIGAFVPMAPALAAASPALILAGAGLMAAGGLVSGSMGGASSGSGGSSSSGGTNIGSPGGGINFNRERGGRDITIIVNATGLSTSADIAVAVTRAVNQADRLGYR